jgi:hypothetical protein
MNNNAIVWTTSLEGVFEKAQMAGKPVLIDWSDLPS